MRDRPQVGVAAVDGLRPRGDRPARGDLEHVGRKPPVGEAQVQRGAARVALELEIGDLGWAGPFRQGVGDRALDERLVSHRLLV